MLRCLRRLIICIFVDVFGTIVAKVGHNQRVYKKETLFVMAAQIQRQAINIHLCFLPVNQTGLLTNTCYFISFII